jgi:tRNA pseudouridine38-40 synthase
MRNIALILEYLGTAYHGWQVQKFDVTVGQTLERAPPDGRGPSGAHRRLRPHRRRRAREKLRRQFPHLDSGIPADRLPYALNTHLPQDIVVRAAMDMHDGFNAIGSCVRKEYTYLIYNSAIRDPFYVNRAWLYPKRLDEAIMRRAGAAVRRRRTTSRRPLGRHGGEVHRADGLLLRRRARAAISSRLRVSANGFLYNMAQRHGRHLRLRRRGQVPAGGDRGDPAPGRPHRRRADGAAGRAVSDETLV